jgi:hypothetical protein
MIEMIIGPFLLLSALAARQPSTPTPAPRHRRAYVQGLVLLSHHPPATASYHRVSPNLKGTVPVVSVSAGGFLSPVVALEGEFVYGRTVSMPQHFSYFSSEDYIAGSRDLLFNELLRYRPGGRTRFEIVAGGGYARTTASQRSGVVTSGFPPQTSTSPDFSYPLNAVTLTGGVDAAIPISARVALTPAFRFRWIRRPDATTGESLGIGNYAIQFGAGLRFW